MYIDPIQSSYGLFIGNGVIVICKFSSTWCIPSYTPTPTKAKPPATSGTVAKVTVIPTSKAHSGPAAHVDVAAAVAAIPNAKVAAPTALVSYT